MSCHISPLFKGLFAKGALPLVLIPIANSASADPVTSKYAVTPGISSYTHFPPAEGPGLDGCVPNNFQCDFSITGVFDLEISENGQSAKIVQARFPLSGNENVFGQTIISNPKAPLLDPEYELISTTSGVTTFRDTRYRDTPLNPFTLQLVLDGADLTLTGGDDLRDSDGGGFDVKIHATLIPEPSDWTEVDPKNWTA